VHIFKVTFSNPLYSKLGLNIVLAPNIYGPMRKEINFWCVSRRMFSIEANKTKHRNITASFYKKKG
jgi:hypothetical protein